MSAFDQSLVSLTVRAGDEQSHHSNHKHVDHCFRYLRQSILCASDTALEGQDPNTKEAGTDGIGAIHMCKNFDEIFNWAESNRVVDSKHI